MEYSPAGGRRFLRNSGQTGLAESAIARRPEREIQSDYIELLEKVRAAGLLKPRYGAYGTLIAANAALYLLTWGAFVLLGDSWWQIVTAVILAISFTQTAFLAHDASHSQILVSRSANRRIGIVHANLAIGICYGWWAPNHFRHHAYPNHEQRDPDLTNKFMLMTRSQAGSHDTVRYLPRRVQAFAFLPLLSFQAVSMHIKSALAIPGFKPRGRTSEAVLLFMHFLAYSGMLIVVLSPWKVLVFFAVQQGLFGIYLGCVFAINHKGMPTYDNDDMDFVRRQVVCSRNIRGGRLVSLATGGLNYQIEHHLFPRMPRSNFRLVRPLVQDFCRSKDIPYTEVGVLGSFGQVMLYLHRLGKIRRPHDAYGIR
ncbi:acyl-CoA desaturase [Frankia sp. Cr1]|uniref:fatty acid desaturase family protein n=1 Tax=Frankia sp. Cr1 TaxID=3073931 RepID=UPI002AD525E8|nr:acyl-CoA desaturase [Frankia sp. Cr1]